MPGSSAAAARAINAGDRAATTRRRHRRSHHLGTALGRAPGTEESPANMAGDDDLVAGGAGDRAVVDDDGYRDAPNRRRWW